MSSGFDCDLFGHPSRATYPNSPGHRGVTTSIEAAVALVSSLGELQNLTLEFIAARGALGATSDECAAGLGLDRRSIQPRTSELKRKGMIVDSKIRRRNSSGKSAIVWTLPRFKRPTRDAEA